MEALIDMLATAGDHARVSVAPHLLAGTISLVRTLAWDDVREKLSADSAGIRWVGSRARIGKTPGIVKVNL